MRFSLLLFGMCQAFRVGSLVNKPLKHHIKNASIRILFKTLEGDEGRLLIFDKGRVRSLPGANHNFDLALVFKDASTGFSVLSSRKNDAVFNAAASGNLHLEGMSAWAMWFEGASKLLI